MRKKVQAVCEDGTLRVVHQGHPDTMFSAPARAKIKGVKVFGFVMMNEHDVLVFRRCDDQYQAQRVYRRSVRP